MADEARNISIQVQATQAINQLQKLASALEKIGGAVGSSDAVLRNLDQQLTRIPGVASTASSAIANLKKEVKTLASAQTSSATATNAVATANSKAVSNTSAITQSNLRAASSFDALRAAAAKANVTTNAGSKAISNIQGGKLGDPLVQTAAGYFPNGAVSIKAMNKELAATAAATTTATRGIAGTTKSLGQLADTVQTNALRYQLYDVAATLGIVGAAALTSGLAVTKAGIEWDKNFANVVRTSQVTGTAVGWLKDQFLELQTLVPVSSADLANIATLGSQMGVSAGAIANFTKITAEFSATSGLNVDESATALSRLNQLLPDVHGNFEKLASTILRTGVNAVATEAQITRGTSQIASMGQIAGMTTPEVVALSSAMSSLGFSPELQRSVITSSFSKIMMATSEVTDKTSAFGAVLKMTGKEFQQAWRGDAIGTFQSLMTAIASRGDAVTVLKDLGLASQRLTPNLLKLGQNSEVLTAALSDTRDEWGKNTELSRQYGIISDTVSAKIQVLGQTWESLLVTLDDSDVVIKPLIEGLTAVVRWLQQVANTPGVSALASVGTALVSLSGVIALGAAGMAAAAAGYIAITNASRGLSLMTLENAAATTGNTVTIMGNTAARGANAEAALLQTGAVTGNTVAMGANAAASGKAGLGMLGFTGKVIGALGPILKWTTIIGVAAAALTGFISLVATAPDWTLAMDQAFAGADTPGKKIKFDTDRIKELSKASKDALEEQKRARSDYAAETAKQQKEIDDYNSRVSSRLKKTLVPQGIAGSAQAGAAEGASIQQMALKTKAAFSNLEKALMDIKTPEDQLRALNDASKELGMSTGELLKKLPGLKSVLGDNAVAMAEAAEEADKLDAAQSLWAIHLNTTEDNLKSLKSGVSSAAGSFLDLGGALSDAYEKDEKTGARLGGGFKEFVKTLDTQVADFQTFYGKLGELVQRGGIQLATLIAQQGPGAMDALTDALKLDPTQISQIESQMSLAAFYASDAFANTFAQNNSILDVVWNPSGHNPVGGAAFNQALNDSMKGGVIDPVVLAQLAEKFGIKIDVGMIPDFDPTQFDTIEALLHAKITPIKIPVTTNVGQGDFTVTREIEGWIVDMEGHAITMNVDPNTDRGRQIISQWRANEYRVPVELLTHAQTNEAAHQIDSLISTYAGKRIPISLYLNMPKDKNGRPINVGQFATGGMISGGKAYRSNYPGYATGTIFRGPGSGTSDSILARVSDGEAITRARAVRYYGTRMMEDINNMRFPRYATGFTPSGGNERGPQQVINATVVQNYPTTRNPIKALKQDAEAVIAGIWA